jgi:hypothetical protein
MDTPDSPDPKRRLSLTKAQLREEIGAALLDILKSITGDGELAQTEIEQLAQWLQTNAASEIPAIAHLATILRRVLADGVVSPDERLELQLGIEKVLPLTERGFAKAARETKERETRTEKITRDNLVKMVADSASKEDNEDEEFYRKARRDWRNDPMTDRQRDYIFDLGGSIHAGATKGEASDLIETLLGQRPPTNRQQMVLRFWARSRKAGEGPAEISEWQDSFYSEDPDRKNAWELFKEESNDDGRQGDPNRVPLGIGPEYLARIKSGPKNQRQAYESGEPRSTNETPAVELAVAKKGRNYVGLAVAGFIIIMVVIWLSAGRNPSSRARAKVSPQEFTENETATQPNREELRQAATLASPAPEVRNLDGPALSETITSKKVAALKITGLIGGSRPRVLIDGKLYAAGEIVDAATGLSVRSINMQESAVLFTDRGGIIHTRSLR